jgi:hypothetical protein
VASSLVDRLGGYRSSLAIKAPCYVATSGSNITLSGYQVVDGVTLSAADENPRVLVKDQTDARENGIYIASSGLWQRAVDFNGNNDFIKGTRVYVHSGATSYGAYVVTTADPIVVGDDDITFVTSIAVDNNFGLIPGVADNELLRYDSSTGGLQSTNIVVGDDNSVSGVVNQAQTGYHDLTEIAAPSTPGSNVARLYSVDDAGTTKLAYKDSAGTVTDLGYFTQTGTGAVLQGLQDYLRDNAVHLLDFIPTAERAAILAFTSTTDVSSYVQACVDAAAGRFIYVRAGRYRLGSGISSTSPINMFGDGNGCGPGAASIANSGCTQFVVAFSSGDVFYVEDNQPSIFRDFQLNTLLANRPRSSGAGIHISGPSGSVNANSVVQGVGMTQQYDGVKLTRTQMSRTVWNYFDGWVRNAVYALTSSGVEGSGGVIRDNYFFGTSGSTSQVSCVRSEVGYVWVTNNLMIGANVAVEIQAANYPAGSIHVLDNWIENQGSYGIRVSSLDGNAISMLNICRNEFSNVSFVSSFAASIVIADYSSGTDYLDDVRIAYNVHRHVLSVNHRFIWVQSGRTVNISHEQMENLGVGASTIGVDLSSLASAALKAPVIVEGCQFRGTFGSGKYLTTSVTKVVDHNGLTAAELPSTIGDGSFIYVTDGAPGTVPVTGSSTGCFAERLNGVWSTGSVADADVTALANNSTNGFWARTGAGTGAARTLQAPAAGFTITNPAGTAGDPTFVLANDLAALEGLSSTGFAARTTTDTWAQRTLTAPAAGFTITNPAGIAGNPTFVLANDLAAVEGLSTTGVMIRTATDTMTATYAPTGLTAINDGPMAGLRNRLINGCFRVNQRVSTSNTDDTYANDRWNILTQTAAVGIGQQTNIANGWPFAMRITQSQASAQRFGTNQIIQSDNCRDLRGQTVVASARVRCSAATSVRISVLEWTGTADAVTSDSVNDWTSSTFTTGNFFISTTTTLVSTTTTALGAATETVISTTGAVSSSMNNLIVLISTDGTQAQNVTLDVGEAMLEVGATATAFEIRPFSLEKSLCLPYFQKSYADATAPGTNFGAGTTSSMLNFGHASGSFATSVVYAASMRSGTPTLTIYDAVGTAARVTNYTGSWVDNNALTASAALQTFFFVQTNIVSAVQTAFMYTVSAEL